MNSTEFRESVFLAMATSMFLVTGYNGGQVGKWMGRHTIGAIVNILSYSQWIMGEAGQPC